MYSFSLVLFCYMFADLTSKSPLYSDTWCPRYLNIHSQILYNLLFPPTQIKDFPFRILNVQKKDENLYKAPPPSPQCFQVTDKKMSVRSGKCSRTIYRI